MSVVLIDLLKSRKLQLIRYLKEMRDTVVVTPIIIYHPPLVSRHHLSSTVGTGIFESVVGSERAGREAGVPHALFSTQNITLK